VTEPRGVPQQTLFPLPHGRGSEDVTEPRPSGSGAHTDGKGDS